MPNKRPMKLNESWVREHLRDVTDIESKVTAWVLVQEPGFIGFGVVRSDKIWWPPYKSSGWDPAWELVNELRLFGEKGEWHVWRDWDGNHYARLLEFTEEGAWSIRLGPEEKQQFCSEKNGEKINTLTEYHALWGSDVKIKKSPWIKLVEDRGAEIWLPLKELKDSDTPLRLKLKQIIDYDSDYHLAGIIDAALVELVCKSGNPLPPPVDLSSCS